MGYSGLVINPLLNLEQTNQARLRAKLLVFIAALLAFASSGWAQTNTLASNTTSLASARTKAPGGFTGSQEWVSEAVRPLVIELYTSQGCSSCPPAERWLNSYRHHPKLWKSLFPLAFHVDYWDDLGWPDPFASKAHSERQYQHRRQGNIASVYTPGFVINGQEWRGWFMGDPLPQNPPAAGILRVNLANQQLSASYQGKIRPLDLHLVILGFDIRTRVKRGENRNKTLPQEFVVLKHEKYHSKRSVWRLPLPRLEDHQSVQSLAINIWVSEAGHLAPLQAVGGWLNGPTR